MADKGKLADLVQQARIRNGWRSTRHAALSTGISHSTLWRIETGAQEEPSIRLVRRLKIAFGLTDAELLSLFE